MIACNYSFMPHILGIVSQKGGVGKSTLARMMARELIAGGLTCKIADMDTQQQTCTLWAGRRAEGGVTPDIQVQGFPTVRTALGDAPRFDALILDGKPHASDQTLEIARAADLVVIPTGQTLDDLHPGVMLAHGLRKAGIEANRIAFVLYRVTGSIRERAAARAWIEEAGYAVLEGEVPASTAYGSASDAGRAITETPFKSLNQRAGTLAQAVVDKLVELQEAHIP